VISETGSVTAQNLSSTVGDVIVSAQQNVEIQNATGNTDVNVTSETGTVVAENLLSETGSTTVQAAGDITVATVGAPQDISIVSETGDIALTQVGGDHAVAVANGTAIAHSPTNLTLQALAEGSTLDLENLTVQETVEIHADHITVEALQSTANQPLLLDIAGNDGTKATEVTMHIVNNTPTVFDTFYAQDFLLTTDNDELMIRDGEVGNIGVIDTNRYLAQVSAFHQLPSIYDYQLYTPDTKFNSWFTGPDLYSTNIASYVNPEYVFNGIYRSDESFLSILEKMNSRVEDIHYEDIWKYVRLFEFLRELELENIDLFESHLEQSSILDDSPIGPVSLAD